MRVVILANIRKAEVEPVAHEIRSLVERHADVVVFDLLQEVDLGDVTADVAIVLGGDGAILRAAHQMGSNQLPVVGVNLGKLGFLAEFSPDEFPSVLQHLVEGRYSVVEHLMLRCELHRGDTVVCQSLSLNEVIVQAGPPFRMIEVALRIDGEHVATFAGDGLIVATPVGSTAHSLAAGGPILRQDIDAVVVTPLCPHTLTARPLVDAADRVFTLTVSPAVLPWSAHLVVDGINIGEVRPEERVVVRRAPERFRLLQLPDSSYYRRLREKLGWGGDPRKDNNRR